MTTTDAQRLMGELARNDIRNALESIRLLRQRLIGDLDTSGINWRVPDVKACDTAIDALIDLLDSGGDD